MLKSNKLILILGQTNTGKSSIFKELMKNIQRKKDNIKLLRSCTTRPAREEDKKGDTEYDFITEEYFKELYQKDEILEHAVYNTAYGKWFYFTRKSDLKIEENNYIKIINPIGFSQIQENLHGKCDIISILIESDEDIRKERALSRCDGLTKEETERRFESDKKDFQHLKTDFIITNNGDKTVQEIADQIYKIINKELKIQ